MGRAPTFKNYNGMWLSNNMPQIHFESKPTSIGPWTIFILPQSASSRLPSRGQVMVKGAVNGFKFQTALEPDGKGSHWFRVSKQMQKTASLNVGQNANLTIESTKEWPEPKVPKDLNTALKSDPQMQSLWMDVTPMARWEWIRWVGSTNQAETRKRRIEATQSKLLSGWRRPCCFNRNMCCVPDVSKNGVLLEPK
jgi:hypothetical protein